MSVTHTLIPNQLIVGSNISTMTVNLTELSDGDSGTGMIVDPANGVLVCGTNYVQVAEYIIAEDNDSSFTFATYNANSENNDTDQLNGEQVNNMQFTIGNGLGIIHDLNVTIDSGTGGRVLLPEGRVFLRQGRIRI